MLPCGVGLGCAGNRFLVPFCLTVVKEDRVEDGAIQKTYAEWWEGLGYEGLEREGDLATRLSVGVLGCLGGLLGGQAEFTNGFSENTALQEFSEQGWSEFELEKQLSTRVSDVFLGLFNRFNQEAGARGFARHWAIRGNWFRGLAHYLTVWRNYCSSWSGDEIG